MTLAMSATRHRSRGSGGATRLGFFAVQALAGAALALAWWGTSTTGEVSRQVDWLVVAVAALFVVVGANLGRMLVERRGLKLRRVRMARMIETAFGAVSTGVDEPDDLVAAAAMSRYHRDSCQLVEGKVVRADNLAAHLQAARTACGVCKP